MDRDRLVATLHQIKALVDEAIGDIGRSEPARKNKKVTIRRATGQISATEISFDTNVLAFMNRYARGLKGPQKFILLLARLAKGSTTRAMSFREVKKQWNKMKSVMGGELNPAYANRAKAKGWVDAPKHGVYTLSASWKEALADLDRS